MLEAGVPHVQSVDGWWWLQFVGMAGPYPANSASCFAVVGKSFQWYVCRYSHNRDTRSSVKPKNKERYRITSFFSILSFLPWFCEKKKRQKTVLKNLKSLDCFIPVIQDIWITVYITNILLTFYPESPFVL